MRSYNYHFQRLHKNIIPIHQQLNKEKSAKFYKNLVHFETGNKQCFFERRCLHTVATVQNRTSKLLELLENAKNDNSRLVRLEELNEHLLRYPSARSLARRSGVTRILQHCHESMDKQILGEARKGLVLLGWTVPVKGQGIKILSIDGGGSRGVIPIEILKRIQDATCKEIHEMFDLICGSSTGAILAFLLGVKKTSLDECTQMYRHLGQEIFSVNTLIGTGKLFFNHAYYDTLKFENILRDALGEIRLVDTAADKDTPKVLAVSTIVNQSILRPYVFRNYRHRHELKSHYPGSCSHKLWEALRASSAAPGYFEEFKLGRDIHQDGGLLTNSPCALAIHEAKLIWPSTPIQCVISLGTGIYHSPSRRINSTFSSLREKLLKVVASATDTEAVHTILDDLLPKNVYFRFNPPLKTDIPLDEAEEENLDKLVVDTVHYLDKKKGKVLAASAAISLEKTLIQAWRERLQDNYLLFDRM